MVLCIGIHNNAYFFLEVLVANNEYTVCFTFKITKGSYNRRAKQFHDWVRIISRFI